MTFAGFPPDALDFFVELEGNNERPWWQANKQRFDGSVAEPMRALLDVLEPEFGSFKVFRMNRDVRFSADKSPYKTAHAAMTESDGGAANYVQISATGLFVGAGIYHMARDQLERFRAAVGDDAHGERGRGGDRRGPPARLDIAGIEPALATAPRGWPKDHPRVALLRMKGLITRARLRRPGVDAHPPGGERGRQGVARRRPGVDVAGGQRRPERGAATISVTSTNPAIPSATNPCREENHATADHRARRRRRCSASAPRRRRPPRPRPTRRRRPTAGPCAPPDRSAPRRDDRRAARVAEPGDRRRRRGDVHARRLHRHAGARRAVRHVVQQLPAAAAQDPGSGGDDGRSGRGHRPQRRDRPRTRTPSPSTPTTTSFPTSASP